ncbi:MAG: hypothetical protein ACPGJV_04980, partial [Bacteriovoracaceae bacterium]
LTKEKKSLIYKFIKIGGLPTIKDSQKLTFQKFLGLDNKSKYLLRSLNADIKEKIVSHILNEYEDENLDDDIMNNETLEETASQNNSLKAFKLEKFTPLIESLRVDVSGFQPEGKRVYEEETIKTAQNLAKIFLPEDNLDSRVAALAHFFASKLGVDNEYDLSKLFIASLCRNLGVCSFERDEFHSQNFSKSQEYKDHPMHGINLLRESQIEIDDDIFQLIHYNHELAGGQGFHGVDLSRFDDPIQLSLNLSTLLLESSFQYPAEKVESFYEIYQKIVANENQALNLFGENIKPLLEALSNEDQDQIFSDAA